MKLLVALILLLGVVYVTKAATCSYRCTQRVRYTTGCGWFNWRRCTKYRNEAKTCYRTCVHGKWSSWKTKTSGSCSKSCGSGVQTVTLQRFCNKPAPSNGGKTCSGVSLKTERRTCNTQKCPINGGWSGYTTASVGACSKPCGGGTQTVSARRTCTNPRPQYGGSNCRGDATRVTRRSCNTNPCPIHGGWSAYQVQSTADCSVTCGGGRQAVTSRRTCTNPAPRYGGNACSGGATRVTYQSCNSISCPVHGGWSSYQVANIGDCSVTCGGGRQDVTSSRTCSNPTPKYGGRNCAGSGSKLESRSCNSNPCPIDGGWSEFEVKNIAECSVTCGGGTQAVTSRRTCDNPLPQYGGSDCEGDSTKVDSRSCNTNPCPIDGGWSAYEVENIGDCSVTCGGGTQAVTSQRTCDNPRPQYGGSDCEGEPTKVESQSCNNNPCPIDGGWSEFEVEDIAECSVTCGGGARAVTSRRTCDNPLPQYGGSDCEGDATKVESQSCNENPCPIDGGWSDFEIENIGECSVTCGGGNQDVTSRRTCDNPRPQYGGSDCDDDATKVESRECNTHPCPIDGGWSDYEVEHIGECSVTCGGGIEAVTSRRTCDNPTPQYGGSDCGGNATKVEYQDCNPNPCPVDGGWSDWDDWQDYDECSAFCGGGSKDQWRMRRCDSPAPAHGGKNCEGPVQENGTVECNTDECGDRCPDGANTFIANDNTASRYYQCDHGVARLMHCPEDTVWDQASSTCARDTSQPIDCAEGTVWDPATSSCIHDGSQQVQTAVQHGDPCDSSVLYSAHQDCTKYVMCIHGSAQVMSCPAGLRFNPAIGACDWASNVPCDN